MSAIGFPLRSRAAAGSAWHSDPLAPHVFEVAELAGYVRSVLEADPVLADVWLRGEVCNLSRSGAGHAYFHLKDAASQLKCVLFRGNAIRSPAQPSNGLAVVAHGRVRFYEAQGTCELLVDMLFPEGMGLAQMQLEALTRRLEAEGLFDTARKRPIPRFPRRIGVVTSEGGAVIHDLLTVLGRRYPLAEVVFAPSQVQGAEAASQVVAALRALGTWVSPADGLGVDVVVVARGGGSAEDLATFNDEGLVRAIFASRAPVVSAVGHETDVTLADLVADLRAPTPSAAAEMISPDLDALRRELMALHGHAAQLLQAQLDRAGAEVQAGRVALQSTLSRRLQAVGQQVAARRLQLEALSPEATLARGYAIAEVDTHVLTDARQARAGAALTVRLHRGRVDATVTASHADSGARQP